VVIHHSVLMLSMSVGHPCYTQNMPGIQLSSDLSEALLSLLSEGKELVEAVEVGPWFTVPQIRAYRQRLLEMPFLFHAADMVESLGTAPGSEDSIKEYLACTDSPWVSVHISVWNPGEVGQMKNGQKVALPDQEKSAQLFIQKVNRLKDAVQVPVLIENVEPLAFEGYDFWARPDFINRVMRETDCNFLLDTGHARISAKRLNMDIHVYVQQLPLDRVVQVHVSGPRLVDGQFVDAHQPLQDEDYDLLNLILESTHPQVVTLEYIQEAQALREQLLCLRDLLTNRY
jgi:uncharacterized protein (UPF0276 family)